MYYLLLLYIPMAHLKLFSLFKDEKKKKIKNNSNLGKDGLMTKKIPDSTLKLF